MTFSEMIRGNPDDPAHGTAATYQRHKCRCDRCRAANTKHVRDYRKRQKESK